MRSRLLNSQFGFLLAASTAVPLVAYCNNYMTEEQAVSSIFPGEKLNRKMIDLNTDEVHKIVQQSDERVHHASMTIWMNEKKEVVFIDQVFGKHEFITYAVGITSQQTVKEIEILEYRETYGYQVNTKEWKQQFIGKRSTDPLKLNQDIVNISGATLSSSHITGGVRRLLKTYEIIRNRL